MANLGTWGAAQNVQAGQNLVGTISGQTNNATAQAVGAANAQSSLYGNAAKGLGGTVNTLFNTPNFQNTVSGLFNNQSLWEQHQLPEQQHRWWSHHRVYLRQRAPGYA